MDQIRSQFQRAYNKLFKVVKHDSVVHKILRGQVKAKWYPSEFLFFLEEKKNKNILSKHARRRFENNINLRNKIYKRDGYCCKKCKSNLNLEIHHIKSIKSHPELAQKEYNLILLCRKCHRKT